MHTADPNGDHKLEYKELADALHGADPRHAQAEAIVATAVAAAEAKAAEAKAAKAKLKQQQEQPHHHHHHHHQHRQHHHHHHHHHSGGEGAAAEAVEVAEAAEAAEPDEVIFSMYDEDEEAVEARLSAQEAAKSDCLRFVMWLSLAKCPGLSAATIGFVSMRCPLLRCLNLGCNDNSVNDQGLRQVARYALE